MVFSNRKKVVRRRKVFSTTIDPAILAKVNSIAKQAGLSKSRAAELLIKLGAKDFMELFVNDPEKKSQVS